LLSDRFGIKKKKKNVIIKLVYSGYLIKQNNNDHFQVLHVCSDSAKTTKFYQIIPKKLRAKYYEPKYQFILQSQEVIQRFCLFLKLEIYFKNLDRGQKYFCSTKFNLVVVPRTLLQSLGR
jgi:hypothetical protein